VITLTTDRLLLRQPTAADVPYICDYVNRNRDFLAEWEPERTEAYYTEPYWHLNIENMREAFNEERQIDFFLFDKVKEKRVVGKVSFPGIIRGAFHACYLGFAVDREVQGRGLMYEALKAAIIYMFKEQNIHRIMANHLLDNHRSATLLRRLGFVREGVAKDYLLIAGRWQDHILTSLTNRRWEEKE
jgi:ribosomal-protein-alanine N-acetyltransferase